MAVRASIVPRGEMILGENLPAPAARTSPRNGNSRLLLLTFQQTDTRSEGAAGEAAEGQEVTRIIYIVVYGDWVSPARDVGVTSANRPIAPSKFESLLHEKVEGKVARKAQEMPRSGKLNHFLLVRSEEHTSELQSLRH